MKHLVISFDAMPDGNLFAFTVVYQDKYVGEYLRNSAGHVIRYTCNNRTISFFSVSYPACGKYGDRIDIFLRGCSAKRYNHIEICNISQVDVNSILSAAKTLNENIDAAIRNGQI